MSALVVDDVSFLDRLRGRAAALGRSPDELEMQWGLAVRDMSFPITREGHLLLGDPWNRWAEIEATPAMTHVLAWLLMPAPEQTSGLLLYGPPGTGKSFAAAFLCVVRDVLRPEGGEPPEWLQAAEMAHRITYARDVRLSARTAVLDDLGASSVTDAQVTALESFLDSRGKPGRATVITSNAQPSALKLVYRARAASRFALFRGGEFVCQGKDRR